MYTQYFGLREEPFALTPDPRFLYLSLRHQEALAHLMYGITAGGGFVQLTGEVGTGKTMMIRTLLERLPENVDVALILYPFLSVREFVAAICDELQVSYPKEGESLKVLIDALNAYLLENHAKGRRTVLIIDEAHKLSRELLEQIRLLTNLETTKEKLLQILLIAQPELNSLLAQPDLRQLAQRVTARYILKPLTSQETSKYIAHRLRAAGAQRILFTKAAMHWAYRLSGGIPRMINVICDRALLGAYARGKTTVGVGLVRHAAAEIGRPARGRALRYVGGALAALVVAGVILTGWQFTPLAVPGRKHDDDAVAARTGTGARDDRRAPSGILPVNTAVSADQGSRDSSSSSAVTILDTEPRTPDLQALLTDPNVPTDTTAAFTALFARWDKDYGSFSGSTGCDRALDAGLRCVLRFGTWSTLHQLNRPVIIELIDRAENRHHVLVTRLVADRVTMTLGDREYEYPANAVDRFWHGKFLLVWAPPKFKRRLLRVGSHGSEVVWVRRALRWYSGLQVIAPADEVFDEDLEAQVKDFQRRHRLDPDGIVGELTLLQLNTYNPHAPPPVLWRVAQAKSG